MGDAGRARLHTPMTLINSRMGKEGPVIRRVIYLGTASHPRAGPADYPSTPARNRHLSPAPPTRSPVGYVHRIGGNHPALDVKQFQQLRQCLDLMGSAIHLNRSQHWFPVRRTCLHQMQRRALRRVLKQAPEHFAVHPASPYFS